MALRIARWPSGKKDGDPGTLDRRSQTQEADHEHLWKHRIGNLSPRKCTGCGTKTCRRGTFGGGTDISVHCSGDFSGCAGHVFSCAKAAVEGATPLSQNRYKIQLARVAVKRAILKAATGRLA